MKIITRKKRAFSDLPLELREHIWDLAIWNHECLPEAHFFNASTESNLWNKKVLEGCYKDLGLPEWMNLKSPCWNPSEPDQAKWASDENISGYTQDSGLWSACVESRQALLRLWKGGHGRPSHRSSLQLTRNFKIPTEENEFSIVLHLDQDLVCINPAHLRDLGENSAIESKHMGFEFDPSWLEECERRWAGKVWYLEEGTCQQTDLESDKKTTVFDDLLKHLERFENQGKNLWLIDYGLEPTEKFHRDKVARGGGMREVFLARNRRFVEIQPEDVRPQNGSSADHYWWGVDVGSCDETVDGGRVPARSFAFAQYVSDYVDQLARRWVDTDMYPEDLHSLFGPIVRVLGCVLDEE